MVDAVKEFLMFYLKTKNDKNKRSPFNVNSLHLRANTTAADTSETNLDIDTGGIKIRTSPGGWNTSGTTYIYLAFGTPLIDVDGRIITGF